jgi:hypothetical protein
MAYARVLIVGRSDFGLLGALFNEGTKIFAPQGIMQWTLNTNAHYYKLLHAKVWSTYPSNGTYAPTYGINGTVPSIKVMNVYSIKM